jgi:hypothetical protein
MAKPNVAITGVGPVPAEKAIAMSRRCIAESVASAG